MSIPVHKHNDRILATLSLIEDHAKSARGSCAAAVHIANLPPEPKVVAPSASESLRLANGQAMKVGESAETPNRHHQLAQLNGTAGQHLSSLFMLEDQLHKLVTDRGDAQPAEAAG